MSLLCGAGDSVCRPVEQNVMLLAPLGKVKVLDRPSLLPEEFGEAVGLVRLARENDDCPALAWNLSGGGWQPGRRRGREARTLEGEKRVKGRGRAGGVPQALPPAPVENL
jgi:hypothetical protein